MRTTTHLYIAMGLTMACALAAHAAPEPWVIALDKARGEMPLVLVLRDRDGKLAGEAYASTNTAMPVSADVTALTRTETALHGAVTVPAIGGYRLQATVTEGVLTGRYQGKTGETVVEGALIWGAGHLPHGHPLFSPTPDRPVGWRGGTGSGYYPAATPSATTWDDTTRRNIIWRTPLPYLSAASAIVVGDRVFTTAEPDDLVCVDARTGEVLWRHGNNPILEKLPEDARAKALALHAKFLRLAREWHYDGKRCELDFIYPPARAGIPDAAKAWLESKKGLLAELELTGVDLTQLALDFYKTRGDESKPHGLMPPHGNYHWYGGCMGTPISDGTYVYAKFSSGALVCYDLDGKRRWMTDRGLRKSFNDVSSLALADGLVLDHGKVAAGDMAIAYDARTGTEVWRTPAAKGNWASASPITARIGETWVLLTGGGDVLRVRDGEKLLTKQWNAFTASSPIIHDGVVYACNMAQGNEGSIGAVRLRPGPDATVTGEVVWWWTKWWRGNRGFASTEGLAIDEPMPGAGRGSPAYANGYVYYVGGAEALEITVVNAVTGQPVPFKDRKVRSALFAWNSDEGKRLGITAGRETCVSATVAGDYLFLGHTTVPRSVFVVFKILPDGQLEEVARNTVEGMTVGTPFFQGGRMYVRTFDYLYCIGIAQE